MRAIDAQKMELGTMSMTDAQERADAENADVIAISEDADPPLVRIMAINKFRYEQERDRKGKAKSRKDAQQELKELKMTPRTAAHDLKVRPLLPRRELVLRGVCCSGVRTRRVV